jgi:hypothetical protein
MPSKKWRAAPRSAAARTRLVVAIGLIEVSRGRADSVCHPVLPRCRPSGGALFWRGGLVGSRRGAAVRLSGRACRSRSLARRSARVRARRLLAASLAFAEFADQWPDWPGGFALQAATGSVGVLVPDTPIAPYLAFGGGWMRETLPPPSPGKLRLTSGGEQSGALLLEVGVQGWRRWRNGRVIIFVQLMEPLFDAASTPFVPPLATRTAWRAGLRLLF